MMSLGQDNISPQGLPSGTTGNNQQLNSASQETNPVAATPHVDYRCGVCGRQDHTLRFVVYPYVISLLVITFRRAFVGLWCRKHANVRLITASLVSACMGWLGIPFGFVYTPQALYNLARGGIHLDEQNRRMLLQVAADKASQGDQAGWKRCMEESLKFQPNPNARQELSLKYLSVPTTTPPGIWTRLGRGLGVLLVALGLGAIVGFLSFLLSLLIGLLTQGSSSIFIVIFSWTSYFALAFLAGILLTQVLESFFTRLQVKKILGAVLFSLLAAVLMVYSIIHSSDFARYLYALQAGYFSSSSEAASYAIYHLIFGAVNYIGWALQDLKTSDLIDLAVLGVILVCDCLMVVYTARRIVQWQRALAETTPAPTAAWKLI